MTDEPQITPAAKEERARNARIRRNLLLLSAANWGVAVVAWTISAYLGITSPVQFIVYTVLFLIGLFAVAVAVAAFLLEKFAHRPAQTPSQTVAGDEPGTAAAPGA